MRTNLFRVVLTLAVVLAVTAPAAAQSIIRGTVVDAEGQPVEGAAVTIEATESNRRAEIETNSDGEFLQIGLASGRYSVTVAKDKMRAVQQATISQGTPAVLSFELSPTSGLTPEQIKAREEMQALAEGALDALRAGRDDEAIEKFSEILVLQPGCSDCHYNLGVAYSNKQDYAAAEAAFQQAIEMVPDSGAAYTGLANVYNAQKKFDLAQQASAKASELGSASGVGGAEDIYNQGVILWNAGKFAEAKVQFEAAVKANPMMAMAQYQLGMANLNLGQIPEARQAFEAYLKADADGPKASEVKAFLQQLPQ